MKVLVIISSKSPQPYLIDMVQSLYDIQFEDGIEYKIVVIDSGSDDTQYYKKLQQLYPRVEVWMVNNKNYEMGAFKQAYKLYSKYDVYMCLQDNMIFKRRVDLSQVTENTAYIIGHHTDGFAWGPHLYPMATEFLKGYNIKFNIHSDFRVVLNNSFLTTKNIMEDIFKTYNILPEDKWGSCLYERLLGIYFIIRGIELLGIDDTTVQKIHQCRQ